MKVLLAMFVLCASAVAQKPPGRVVIGSKTFAESRVLAEMMAQLLEAHTELTVERKLGLGGTLLCTQALRAGEIDLYPEYTGTAWAVILKESVSESDPLRVYLTVKRRCERELGLTWLEPFGLNNTYAIAMTRARAAQLGLTRLSELAPLAGELQAGVSLEFLNRADGWPGLVEAYGIGELAVRGMEHGLAYQALTSGGIDLIDAYSTDGKLRALDLVVLKDDRAFFPPYQAAPLVRMEALAAHPEVAEVLARLAWTLTDETMQGLNLEAEDSADFAGVARRYLVGEGLLDDERVEQRASGASFLGLTPARWRHTFALVLEHIRLTLIAVVLAALFAIPLGVLASRFTRLRQISLGAAGVIQTVPSLALLAFLIPIPGFGLGMRSAVCALFLYALLPILRNTVAGIAAVDPELVEAARGMGLREREVLRHLELPLAAPTILAGVRTSAVISVGVATLAAFIGAGGLGEPILTGLQLDDVGLILSGAIPAALLAIVVELGLGLVERRLTPRAG